jgi:hypothetical protein
VENYDLGVSYCREQYEKGGVDIYIQVKAFNVQILILSNILKIKI